MLLYHGTTKEALCRILDEGVEAPSYWGSQSEAELYEDGAMLCIDSHELSVEFLPNDLLIDAMREDDPDNEALLLWENSAQTWRDSLKIFGSVRCDDIIRLSEEPILQHAFPQPR